MSDRMYLHQRNSHHFKLKILVIDVSFARATLTFGSALEATLSRESVCCRCEVLPCSLVPQSALVKLGVAGWKEIAGVARYH